MDHTAPQVSLRKAYNLYILLFLALRNLLLKQIYVCTITAVFEYHLYPYSPPPSYTPTLHYLFDRRPRTLALEVTFKFLIAKGAANATPFKEF